MRTKREKNTLTLGFEMEPNGGEIRSLQSSWDVKLKTQNISSSYATCFSANNPPEDISYSFPCNSATLISQLISKSHQSRACVEIRRVHFVSLHFASLSGLSGDKWKPESI